MQWLSGRYCTRWSRFARLRVRRKNVLKHPLTQKLLESLQEQIEKATTAFMLQDSIVLILGQLYQIIHPLETHGRGKICWKAAKGSSSKSKWMDLTYLCRCMSYFVLSFLVSSYLILSTLSFLFFPFKNNDNNKPTKSIFSLLLGLCSGSHLGWEVQGLINSWLCVEKFWHTGTFGNVI